ncbi:MAG: hypothetical protein ACTTHG_00535 [Treponemataceae bacterium]
MSIKRFFLSFFALFIFADIFAQIQISNQPHMGAIRSFAINNNSFFTCGDDGFVIKWTENGNGEHYQISNLEIKLIAVSPNGYDIAIYETDNFAVHRVSVWNWKTQTRKFAKRFTDSIVSLGYTEKGSYLTVGTSSVDGLLFLDTLNGTPLSVLNQSTGVVHLAKTGKNEKTMITYNMEGDIEYFNFSEKNKTYEFSCESYLENAMLVHNNRYLAGTKDNKIIVVDATNGKNKAEIDCLSPILVGNSDSDLFYIEENPEQYCYSLKYIPLKKGEFQFESIFIKNFDFRKLQKIDKALIINEKIFISTAIGALFYINSAPNGEVEFAYNFTENPYKKITDIEVTEENVFFIANNNLYSSTILSKEDTKLLFTDVGAKNITLTENNDLILWSKDDLSPVYIIKNENDKLMPPEILFSIDLPITSVNTYEKKIVVVAGNSSLIYFDCELNEISKVYSGTGLQDAILIEKVLYTAKTAITNPKTALITVDISTKETVPLQVNGEIVYGLCHKQNDNIIYGISNSNPNGKKITEVFTYNVAGKKYNTILSWQDEDTTAFLRFINGILYTNIGKSATRAINLSTKKSFILKRSASLPKKIAGNSNFIATLNHDGSITWYNAVSNAKLENWYMNHEDYILSR